jgi:hypothetical protein
MKKNKFSFSIDLPGNTDKRRFACLESLVAYIDNKPVTIYKESQKTIDWQIFPVSFLGINSDNLILTNGLELHEILIKDIGIISQVSVNQFKIETKNSIYKLQIIN